MDEMELKRILAFAEMHEKAESHDPTYFTEYVVERIEDAYVATRDPSLHVLRNAVAGRKDILISRAELSALWNESGSVGSYDKVREELGDLLGTESELIEISHVSGLNNGVGAETLEYVAPDAAVYASLFNGGYRSDLVKVAGAIEAELAGLDIDSDLEVKAFDTRFAVIEGRVAFDGKIASVVIPFEIEGGAKFPSVFYGNGFAEFNEGNLKAWASAGGRVSADAEMILDHLNEKAGRLAVVASDESWSPMVDTHGIDLGTDEVGVSFNMEIPVELAAGLDAGADFEAIFREAGASCGLEKIAMAKRVLDGQIKMAGVAHDKVVFASEFDGGVILGTHIKTASGKAYVKVPVEFVGNSVAIPDTFQYGNRSVEFNAANLKSLAMSGESDYSALASPIGQMKFADLHRVAIKCASNGDLSGAEEAMSVILENYGEDHYTGTFKDMMSLMNASETMEAGEFDKYAAKLSEGGDLIAHYVGSKVNLGSFGLL